MKYKVQVLYFNKPGYKKTVYSSLTLDQAQAICSDPETSSSTCTKYKSRKRTKDHGPWFYCYTEDK